MMRWRGGMSLVLAMVGSVGCASTPEGASTGGVEPTCSDGDEGCGPPATGEATTPSSTTAATEPTTTQVIKLAPYEQSGHRALTVAVAGTERPLLFDTGGGVTLITPDLAEAAGCKPTGRLTGYRMRGDRVDFSRCDGVALSVAGAPLRSRTVGVFDLNKLLPPTWARLGGLISLASFEGQQVAVDLPQSEVRVTSNGTPLAGATGINLVRQASGFSVVTLVPSPTPAGALWLEVDTGSDAPLILAPHAARMLGIDLDGDGVTHTPARGAEDPKGPAPERWQVEQLTLTLPGVGAVQTSASVFDMIYDGNIGAPLIEQFVWTFDLQRHEVLIERP